MPLQDSAKIAIGSGAALVVVGIGVWAVAEFLMEDDRPPKPGSILCPADVGRTPAPTGSLSEGDFVVVQLQSSDGSFSESTWATVLEVAPDSVIAVVSGEQIPEGVRALRTDKHGFRLGHRLVLERGCIWEVFRPAEHGGQILCGSQITELAEKIGQPQLFPVKAGLTVQPGDRAEIVVGSEQSFGTAWFEILWTRIVTISPTGQVITAIVSEQPERTEHKLSLGSVVRYNRDCIVGV